MARHIARRRAPWRTRSPLALLGVVLLALITAAGGLVVPSQSAGPRSLGANGRGAPTGEILSGPATSAPGATLGPEVSGTLTVSLSINRSSTPVGSPIQFTGSVTPSTGSPYNLSWLNLPSGCSSGAPNVTVPAGTFAWSCTPTGPGSTTVSVTARNGTGATGSGTAALAVYPDLTVSLTLPSSSIQAGTQLSVSWQVEGGLSPYQLTWQGLPNDCRGPAPSSQTATGSNSFTCNPSQSGSYPVSLKVTDSGTPTPASDTSPTQSVTVNANSNSNSNGNSGGNNGSGGKGNNGNFSIPFLSNLGGILPLLFIVGIVAFLLLVITAIATLTTAILLARRLPPRGGRGGSVGPCPSCGKSVALGGKFCPECGKPFSEKPSA